MNFDSNQDNSNNPLDQTEQLERRQTLRIALAVFLCWIAISSSSNGAGQCETQVATGLPIQRDGFTSSPFDSDAAQPRAAAYVQVQAELSNFDRDANADGWLASVVLRSRDGLVLVGPSQATFEIVELADVARIDRFDRNLAGYPFARLKRAQRWTLPLEFNEHGVAVVRLSATPAVQQRLGWYSAATLHRGIRVAERHNDHRWTRADGDRTHNHFLTLNLQDELDFPRVGWLRVRVSLPGQGMLEAVAPIELRPTVLVDTYGRYR